MAPDYYLNQTWQNIIWWSVLYYGNELQTLREFGIMECDILCSWVSLSNILMFLFKSNDLNLLHITFLPLSPPGWRGIVVTVRAGGWAGGCQTCGTHISGTAWRIFSIRSSVELSRPLVVHCHGHLPMCPIWACPWAKNLSNLPQIGSRLCGTQISETAGWIYLKFHGLV